MVRQTHLYLGQKCALSLLEPKISFKLSFAGFFVEHDKLLDLFFGLCFQVSSHSDTLFADFELRTIPVHRLAKIVVR